MKAEMNVVLIEVTTEEYRHNPLSQMARVLEPLAIEYIGAYLKQFGHNVKLLHQLNKGNKEVVEEIVSHHPDMVGISCMTYSFLDAREIACDIKKRLPKTATVLGGYHVLGLTDCPPGFDFVVKGEGERPCRDILEFLKTGLPAPNTIPGLHAYRDPQTGISHHGKCSSLGVTLQTLPFPMREPRETYFSKSLGENLPETRLACIVIKRGCPFHCDFCCTPQLFQGQHGARNIDHVIDEIHYLHDNFGVNTLNLRDETFGPESVVTEFCEKLLKSGLKVHWRAFAVVGTLKHDTLALMAEAGCHMLFYGIEASDPKTLRLRHKSFARHIDRVAPDIEFAQSRGIFVRGGFIVGHETDTEDTFVQHLDFLKKAHPDELYVSFLTPFPGTPLYERTEKKIRERNWRKYDCDHPILDFGIPAEKLALLRQELYRSYYTSDEWKKHIDARAKRPNEKTTIRLYKEFVEERLKTPNEFALVSGS